MFGFKKETTSSSRIEMLGDEIDELKKDRRKLKEEIADLKIKRKVETEDIKHMVRMKEERQELDFKRKEVSMELEKAKDIEKVRNDYRDKVESDLARQIQEGQALYKQILERLPNINVKMTGEV